jgi:hypothetical protein
MLAPNTSGTKRRSRSNEVLDAKEGTLRLARWSAYRAGCHVIARVSSTMWRVLRADKGSCDNRRRAVYQIISRRQSQHANDGD